MRSEAPLEGVVALSLLILAAAVVWRFVRPPPPDGP
jgi:hypothetical protein